MRHCEHKRPPVVHPDAWRPISTEQMSGQLKRGPLNQCADLDEPERVPREPGACHLGEPRNSLSPINFRLLFHLTAHPLMGWSLTWRPLLNNRAVLMGWAPGGATFVVAHRFEAAGPAPNVARTHAHRAWCTFDAFVCQVRGGRIDPCGLGGFEYSKPPKPHGPYEESQACRSNPFKTHHRRIGAAR